MPGPNWGSIDTVLLDLDGTLLDRHHEDFFWETVVPKLYAKQRNITIDEAKSILTKIYATKEMTMHWGDIDYWEKELNMSLWKERAKMKHLLKLHPHTLKFLQFVKKMNKRVYLVTASSPQDVDFKFAIVKIGKYFDGIFSQVHVRKSKKDVMFWRALSQMANFKPVNTMLIDDNSEVLAAAKTYGIRALVYKLKASSKCPNQEPNKNYFCVNHLDDLIH